MTHIAYKMSRTPVSQRFASIVACVFALIAGLVVWHVPAFSAVEAGQYGVRSRTTISGTPRVAPDIGGTSGIFEAPGVFPTAGVTSATLQPPYDCEDDGISITMCSTVRDMPYGYIDSVRFAVTNDNWYDVYVNPSASCPYDDPFIDIVDSCWTEYDYTGLTLNGNTTDSVAVYFMFSWSPMSPSTDYVSLRLEIDWNQYIEADAWLNVYLFDVVPAAGNASRFPGLCANDCFSARYAQSTVGYRSLGVSRNVTLVHNGETVHPRPFLHSQVIAAPGYWLTDVLKMSAQLDGLGLTFLNGAQNLYFEGVSDTMWLGGQFDASTYATGLYWLTLSVEDVSWNGDPIGTTTRRVPFVVVNGNNSAIARGWGVAGVQRMYRLGDNDFVIIDGDGSYVRFESDGWGAAWAAGEAGDFSVLLVDAGYWTRFYEDGTKVVFDHAGYMTKITPPGSALSTVFAYETYGGGKRLKTIADPYRKVSGQPAVTTLNYGTYGLSSIVEPGPSGRTTTFTVNADSNLTHFTDPDAASTVFAYDGSDRLTTVTDRRGGVRAFHHNATTWLLDSVSAPAVYVDQGNGSAALDTAVIRFKPWQPLGVPYGATSANAPFAGVYHYYRTARVVSPTGDTTTYEPDLWGQPLRTINPKGEETISTRVFRPHSVVDTFANVHIRQVITPLVKDVTYANKQKDEYGYDFAWWKVRLLWKQQAGQSRVYYDYLPIQIGPWWDEWMKRPLLLTSISGDGVRTQEFGYSTEDKALGRPTVVSTLTTISGGGEDWDAKYYTYDSVHGRVATVIDGMDQVTTFEYDTIFGNVKRTIQPGGGTQRTIIDRHGRDSVVTSSELAPTQILYDVMDRDTLRTVLTGSPVVIMRKQYDALYDTAVVDGLGHRYRFIRDALGRPIQEYGPNDTASRRYRYDINGRLTGVTNRRGQALALRYDKLGRMTSRTGSGLADSMAYPVLVSDSAVWHMRWNAVARDTVIGKQENVAETGVRTATVFSTGGSPVYVIGQHSTDLWTGSDQITALPANTFAPVTYWRIPWIDAGSDIEVGDSLHTEQHRDLKQRLDWQRLGYGSTMDITQYTRTDRPIQVTFSHARLDTMFRTAYAYDSLNRIVAVQQRGGNLQRQFAYDSLGRLTSVAYRTQPCQTWPGTPDSTFGWRHTCGSADSTKTYTYDAAGNRTDGGAVYDTTNRLRQFGPWTFTYDVDGNMTQKQNTSAGITRRYHWDALNRLVAVVRVGTDSITYEYDAFGRLARRKTNGTIDRHWLYIGAQIYAELDGAFAVRKQYTYYQGLDRPHSIGDGRMLTLQDELGNVVGQVDAVLTTVVQQVSYDPWGKPTFHADGTGSRLLWKGLLWQEEAGLYYVRNRWYDPDVGRFISEDPIGLQGGINLYQFGAGDPINFSDPFGQCPSYVGGDGRTHTVTDCPRHIVERWARSHIIITARGGTDWDGLDVDLKNAIIWTSMKANWSLGISAARESGHSVEGRHAQGGGVDINSVEGTRFTDMTLLAAEGTAVQIIAMIWEFLPAHRRPIMAFAPGYAWRSTRPMSHSQRIALEYQHRSHIHITIP